MKKYVVKMRLRVNGDVHKAGDIVELSDTQATPLLNMKAVTLAPVTAPPVTPVTQTAPSTSATPVTAPVTTPEPTPTAEPASVPNTVPNEPVPNEAVPSVEPVAPVATAEPVQPTTTPIEAPTSTVNAYSNFTKAQLNAELDKRGIAHDSKATNDVLEGLLVADDSKAQ